MQSEAAYESRLNSQHGTFNVEQREEARRMIRVNWRSFAVGKRNAARSRLKTAPTGSLKESEFICVDLWFQFPAVREQSRIIPILKLGSDAHL